MSRARAHLAAILLAVTVAGAAAAADDHIIYDLTEEEYYEMPQLFHMEEYEGCLALGGGYCVGSFELSPGHPRALALYTRMKGYSNNWVSHFNHTRLHRAVCLARSCASTRPQPGGDSHTLETWFASCVNASMMSSYGLWARPLRVEYCARGRAPAPALSGSERAFAALLAALLALAALSTVLDLTLNDHAKKGAAWALSFSIRGSWRALQAPVAGAGAAGAAARREGDTDLRSLDGLRVLCMMCVIIEHVCWLATQAFVDNTREYETMRSATDVMLMINSTLVVQIFFLMSSFLLAHKLLQQRRRGETIRPLATFGDTMLNRIIRVSPSYWVVVWFAASWWPRLGAGPLWAPLVEREAAVCQHKWWTHLLYLNNVIYPDDKCLIQTWYLAADMQLYAWSLALTLLLLRVRRGALALLTALLAAAVAAVAGLAYVWRLVPTYAMHSPELVRAIYSGEASFNVLYQSPLSNSPGALAGLLLAHAHHALLDARINLNNYKWFRWWSAVAPALAVWWAAAAPRLLAAGPPPRAGAAALAALERPVFSFFVALGLLGAMHDVQSPLRTLFSWRGWATPARLSFGVLLLHLPLNKSLIANRLAPSQVTRQTTIFEWFGVALVSYACALPLALLVELPAQALLRALRRRPRAAAPRPPRPPPAAGLEKTDPAD
ncbi:O-acyltransferase like protein-like [Pectinophora gossypiella]|uniref:O-acyltransferase like protein-like n=1 Tax=Pectinophora gossypiella TaxID=13191 RepID=UPI00214E8009|nr:O-acyltransferase like protein-like [Pectinophora gossypiella]